MLQWWKDLSVSKKLYAVVGLMATLIALELFSLLFAMNTLSSVRAFVEGEGLWSKAQKDAIVTLYQYSLSGDPADYDKFRSALQIPMGDRKARLEMLKPNASHEVIRQGFIEGGNHTNDVDGMIDLLQRFHKISYIHSAISAWTEADNELDKLLLLAEDMKATISKDGVRSQKISASRHEIAKINGNLTRLENMFSSSLGAGSRWLETLLITVLALTVLTVEGTGLYLTFRFSRNLNRSLKELMTTAKQVGSGNFSMRAPVHSKDELGQLAVALNEMTDELRASVGERKQAESASQIKSIFLANMSHEIRTPLGIILGFNEILRTQDLSREERDRYMDIIDKTGKNLSRIVNDILDISKVEAGHLETEIQSFPVEDLFNELKTFFEFKAAKSNNKLVLRRNPSAPGIIATDRLRLRQVLTNLLGNALRFTENGTITLTYDSSGDVLRFAIADTGIGLHPNQISKLFGLFSQADQSTTRKYGGTGLGLVLSRRLAEALGGDVVLERTGPGEGSTFVATIRNEPEKVKEYYDSSQEDLPSNAETLKGKRLLVVDDSTDNQLLVNVLLGKYGIEVHSADNGEQGATKAMKGNFDIVLMDIQMPVLDGYQATERLREQGYRKPIIALTANAMKEDWKRCLEAGCNDYLTKPIDASKLVAAIARNIRTKSS